MLNTTVRVEENYHNFLRPVIHESINRFLQFYGLQGIASIYYNGENEIADLVGANQQDPYLSSRYTDMLFRNKLYIVPEITVAGLDNNRRGKTEQPIWQTGKGEDKITITPCFSGVRIDIDVLANFNSKRSAEAFVDTVNRVREEAMVDINFSGTTHLTVNTPIISMLGEFHALLKKNEPATPEFSEWFYGNATRPFTVISNVAGNHKRVATPMKLNNIGLYLSDPIIQLAKKVENFGKYEVSFKYFFYFQRHTQWDLQYPLNVYQDQIAEKWVPRPDPGYTQPFDTNVNPEWLNISGFTTERQVQGPYFLKLPNHDPWAMELRPWMQPIVQARLTVDDVPSQVLLNIFDLPDFVWNPKVKDYMLRRKEYAFSHHQTPFLVLVYSGNILIDPKQLIMDELGNVTLTREPTMKNTHRVVIVLDYAIRDYSDNFWNDLYEHEEYLEFLPAIFPWYRWDRLARPWLDHIDEICKGIDLGTGYRGLGAGRHMMNLGLKAYNLLEYKPNATRR